MAELEAAVMHQLIGRYFEEYAVAEGQVDSCILSALRVEQLAGMVLMANMMMDGKLKMLGSLISIADMGKERKKECATLIEKFAQHVLPVRNIIAHNAWISDDEEQVVFLYVKSSRKKVDIPFHTMSIAAFESAYEELLNYASEFHKISDEFNSMNIPAKLDANPRMLSAFDASQTLVGGFDPDKEAEE